MKERFEAFADLLMPYMVDHPGEDNFIFSKMTRGAISWALNTKLNDPTVSEEVKLEDFIDHLKFFFKDELSWKSAPSARPPTPSQE